MSVVVSTILSLRCFIDDSNHAALMGGSKRRRNPASSSSNKSPVTLQQNKVLTSISENEVTPPLPTFTTSGRQYVHISDAKALVAVVRDEFYKRLGKPSGGGSDKSRNQLAASREEKKESENVISWGLLTDHVLERVKYVSAYNTEQAKHMANKIIEESVKNGLIVVYCGGEGRNSNKMLGMLPAERPPVNRRYNTLGNRGMGSNTKSTTTSSVIDESKDINNTESKVVHVSA